MEVFLKIAIRKEKTEETLFPNIIDLEAGAFLEQQCEICAPVPQENTHNSWLVTTKQHSQPAGSSWHYSAHQPVWANSFCLSTHVTNTETDYILIDKTNLKYLKH